MKHLEAILRPDRLQRVQDALDELGVSGLTVSEVMGCGRQKGYTEQYRGSRANISLLPKLKVEPGRRVSAPRTRARSATAGCSSTTARSRSGSAPASAARSPWFTRPRRAGGIDGECLALGEARRRRPRRGDPCADLPRADRARRRLPLPPRRTR